MNAVVSGIADKIMQRFFTELERSPEGSVRLAEELRRLFADKRVRDEGALIALYERLAREDR